MADNSFSISTSHNVAISYDIAGIGERILAFLIDVAIKTGYSLLLIFFGSFVINKGSETPATIIIFILAMPLLLYTLLFETFMQGQTPGKRARKIKVVKIDGEHAGFSGYLLRWLFYFIDIYFFYAVVGILCIVLNKKGQRLGDMVGGTTVIKISDTMSLKDTLYERISDSHRITYREVRILSERDIETVKTVLNTPEYRENYDMVYILTSKIQSKMNVTRVESFPEDFLKTVVRDYNSLDAEA